MGIMDLFKSKDRANENPSSLEKWETQSAIKECCEKKVTLAVQIDEYPFDFLSMFINENSGKGWIAIDLLKPGQGNRYIEKSRSILLSYKLERVSYNFRSRYIEDVNNGYKAIKISYPKRITNTQKREYFRVEPAIEDTVLVSAKVSGESALEIRGPMRDISEGGLSFTIEPEAAAKLTIGDVFAHVNINLPNTGEIETTGVIRNILKRKNHKFHCGVELLELSDVQILKIYKYVLNRQRDALKRLGKVKTQAP